MSFKTLNLHPGILNAIEKMGYVVPTPIQKQAIPKILEGCDVRASAQTGTGKTGAFLLPAWHRLASMPAKTGRGPRILILVPTRELAMQVAAESAKYSKYLPRMKTVCLFGGVPYPMQNRQLSQPYEVLVATPGRLIDHLGRGRVAFPRLEMLILDEADRMLDMGFVEPVEHIVSALPKERQTLLFSATLQGGVIHLCSRLLRDPVEIKAEEGEARIHIEQRLHCVDNLSHKYRLLDHLLQEPSITQAIIFTSTKSHVGDLVQLLVDGGHEAAALHGDMNQQQRMRTLSRLRQGQIRILVATDVAARGIDVLTISHVINFDLPTKAEDYVHRIGRTGRAGGKGTALSFAAFKDMGLVRRIEAFTGQEITPHVIPGFECKVNPGPKRPSSVPHRAARAPYRRFRSHQRG